MEPLASAPEAWGTEHREAAVRQQSRWRHGATEAAEPLEADRGSVRPELRPRSSRGTEQPEIDRGSVRPVGRHAGEEEATGPVKIHPPGEDRHACLLQLEERWRSTPVKKQAAAPVKKQAAAPPRMCQAKERGRVGVGRSRLPVGHWEEEERRLRRVAWARGAGKNGSV